MKIQFLLTYDHELPLGSLKTSYNKALFEPTERLNELASRLDVPITLFTDILCADRYRQWDEGNFYIPYCKQLQDTIKAGSDVQLHIHPHWLTSEYRNGTVFPSKDYSLSQFADNALFPIDHIIKGGISHINEICRQVVPNYNVTAYRAGGFNIEPSSDLIFSSLLRNGIKYDSSIGPSYYYASALSLVDFRKVPSLPNWHISEDGDFRVNSKCGILEIPVATIPKTPFEMPTRFKLKKYAHRAPEKHGTMLHEGNPPTKMQKLHMLFSSRFLTFDNHTLSAEYLMRMLNYNVQKFKQHDTIILASCSHPKTMGNYSFELMEQFVNLARKKYPEIEFTSFNLIDRKRSNVD